MVLEKEMALYKREKPRLLAEGAEGKHVLIHDETIRGVFDSREEGLTAGYQLFGLDTPFLLKEVHAAEQPIPMFSPVVPKCHT